MVAVLRDQGFKRTSPPRTEGRDAERALQLIGAMPRKVEQGVDVCDREPLGPVGDFYDLVAGADLAFLQHTQVEPWSVMRHQEGRDPRIIHANPDAIAGHAWLRHLEQRIADAIPVADADLVIRKALDREVLAELAEGKIVAAERALPISI